MRSFLSRKSITRTLLLGAVSAALLIPGSPAHAAAASFSYAEMDSGVPGVTWGTSGSCVGEAVSTNGSTMTLLVEGQAVAQGPAIDTAISCHVFVDGEHYGEVGGIGAGPVGVVAGQKGGLPLGPYYFCVETHTTYPDGMSHSWC